MARVEVQKREKQHENAVNRIRIMNDDDGFFFLFSFFIYGYFCDLFIKPAGDDVAQERVEKKRKTKRGKE